MMTRPARNLIAAERKATRGQGTDRAGTLRADHRGRRPLGWTVWLLVCGLSITSPGCGGCTILGRGRPTAEEILKRKEELARKQKEKPKRLITFGRAAVLPGNTTSYLHGVKPGHWVDTAQQITANGSHLAGQLGVAVVDKQGRPARLPGTAFRLDARRPVVLAKQQRKSLETTFFVPAAGSTTRVQTTLETRGGERFKSTEFFNAMPNYQYLFVILADKPDRYAFIKVLDSVRAPREEASDWQPLHYYQVVTANRNRHVTLPSHGFAWSAIAYLLWDDIEPSSLTGPQQRALIDWLYWGGQLIVSGPGSLERLRGSFLSDYLPAVAAGTRSITSAELEILNRHWMLTEPDGSRAPLAATVPWVGVAWRRRHASDDLPSTGGLLIERAVGRGRIVVSAFHLAEQDLVRWRSFDNFFNACLLGRPRRRYRVREGGLDPSLEWADQPARVRDPALTTRVRYLTRDLGRRLARSSDPSRGDSPNNSMAAWNPVSMIANAARDVLRDAAGIAVPPAGFVARVLAVYLLILVPINWAIFRGIGRVEWAWVAAPCIAIACCAAVVHLARLNIGFARSRTEVAVLEAYGGYARADLTRYTALYTSLSTRYGLEFDSPDAVALPLPIDPQHALIQGQTPSTITYQQNGHARLDGFTVPSNSTGMLYSEQILDMGGQFLVQRTAAGATELHNTTHWDLREVVLFRKRTGHTGRRRMAVCHVGRLPANGHVRLHFQPAGHQLSEPVHKPQPRAEAGQIDLNRLVRLVSDDRWNRRETEWLIGRIDTTPPGVRFSPPASQIRSATLVVVHLGFSYPAPQSDTNTRANADD